MLRLSLTEFSLPKFYLLFGISKVKSAAVIAFRSSYRDRSFSPGSYERETFALSSLETVTEALLEIMEVSVHACIFMLFPVLINVSFLEGNMTFTILKFLFSVELLSFLGLHEGHSWMQMVRSVDRVSTEVRD